MIDLQFRGDKEHELAEVVLNSPSTLNALDETGLAELSAAYTEAAKRGVKALLLRGEGRGFCAGRNIRGLDPASDDATAFLAETLTPLLRQMATFPAPTFAVVHGPCLGIGLGLAIACDIAYVAEDATFGSPFAKLGATLDSGGHALFYERLGAHRAMDLIITGELISGAEAVRAGLFSRALPAEMLLEFARTQATSAAAGAQLAFRASRELIHQLRDQRLGLWDSIQAENLAQGALCSTADYAEGFAAFNAKRPPIFRGH